MCWSPDSRSIAFFAGGKLKKVQASGGPPQNICDTPDMRGGTWNASDVILFASSKGLQRVKAVGGEPVPVATPKDAVPHYPSFLPDGQHFLFLSVPAQASSAAIYAGSLDSSDATRLVAAQSNAAYAEPGYLLYHRDGTLYAQPFNPSKLATNGDAVRLADKLPYDASGAAAFSASRTGILIYRNSPPPTAQAASGAAPSGGVYNLPLTWVDRSGKKLDPLADRAGWAGVDLSPNGKRVATHRHDADGGDVWIFEPDRPCRRSSPSTPPRQLAPIWSPDGTHVAFGSHRQEKWGIYVKVADSTKNEEPVTESDVPIVPMTWTPDGQTLLYWTSAAKTQGDVWGLPMTGEKKPFPVLSSPADERHPQVSPSGKWIAYSSSETGRSEIYVQPYPQGAKIQISSNGGVYPRWGRGGQELYFMNLVSAGNLMMSNIRVTGSAIQRDDPKVLFQTGYFTSPHPGGQYRRMPCPLTPAFPDPSDRQPSGRVYAGAAASASIHPPSWRLCLLIATLRRLLRRARASINVVFNWTTAMKED
jgi:Tol biopolymer transport system component